MILYFILFLLGYAGFCAAILTAFYTLCDANLFKRQLREQEALHIQKMSIEMRTLITRSTYIMPFPL